MSAQIERASVARWGAESRDSTFAGGLWAFQAPQEETWPYVVFFPVSDAPQLWTTDSEIREAVYQFSIWMLETSTSGDPIEDLGALMDTLKASFEFAPITITGQDILLFERQGETRDAEEDEVWHGTITYRVRRRVAADYSPA